MARDGTTDVAPLVGYILRAFDPDLDRGQPSIWCNQEEYVAEKPEKIETEKSDVQPMVEDQLYKTINWGAKGPPKDSYEMGKKIGEATSFFAGSADSHYDPLREFDEGVAGLTERRGDIYGHPQDDFDRIIQIQKALDDCDDEFARHIMNMIAVKMSRLVKTPDHSDSWIDIVGYVRTWFMIQERRKENE